MRKLIALSVLACLTMGLIGCSGGDAGTPDTSKEAEANRTAPETTTTKDGSQINMAKPSEPPKGADGNPP